MSPLPSLTTLDPSTRGPTPPLTPTSPLSASSRCWNGTWQVGSAFTIPTEFSIHNNHTRLNRGDLRVVGEDYVSFDAADLDVYPLLRGSAAAIEGDLGNAGTEEVKPPQLSLLLESGEIRARTDVNGNIRHVNRSRRRRLMEECEAEDRLEEEAFWRLGRETIQARIRKKFAEIERMKVSEAIALSEVEAEGSRWARSRGAQEGLLKRTWSTMSKKRRGR